MIPKLSSWLGMDAAIFGCFGVLLFALLVVLSWQIAAEEEPIRPRIFRDQTVGDDSRRADTAGTVRQRVGDTIVVQGVDGSVDVVLPLDAVIQTLIPERVEGVQIGDWVFVGGVDDNVNSFIVKGVVVVDQAGVS